MQPLLFDSLEYRQTLENAGFDRKQAQAQAEALQKAFNHYAEAKDKQLATKLDLQTGLEGVRRDIQDVRLEIKATELRLLKWQFAIALALGAIMAKGFGWLGF